MCTSHIKPGQLGMSLEDCKSICDTDENCKRVEYWAMFYNTGDTFCIKCSTDSTKELTDPGRGLPPSVYKKGISSL